MSEITLISYGMKYGSPNANYVFDVSYIRNPTRDPSFKGQEGTSEEMKKYIMADPIANLTADAIVDFILKIKDYNGMVIALGCTGGRHRSITMVEEVHKRLKKYGVKSKIKHRDKDYVKKVY